MQETANPEITTNHPASSYGVPVLLLGGKAYGPFDKLPNGDIAFYFVQASMLDGAEKFLKSAPDLYFNL